MTNIVDRKRTALSDQELLDLLVRSLGADDTPTRRALMFAQLAFEHGAGADARAPANGRACWNCFDNDFGNRRGISGDIGAFYMTAPEIIDGHERPIGGIWPAYSTPDEGVRTWLVMMTAKYHTAWSASLRGSARDYAQALKSGGYYTTSVDIYTAGLLTWLRIYYRQWPTVR